MNVILVVLHLNEARRILSAASWPVLGSQAPAVVLVNDNDAWLKLQGRAGSLVLISEGAMRHGVDQRFIQKATQNRMVIMCMAEPIQTAPTVNPTIQTTELDRI